MELTLSHHSLSDSSNVIQCGSCVGHCSGGHRAMAWPYEHISLEGELKLLLGKKGHTQDKQNYITSFPEGSTEASSKYCRD